MFDVNQNMICEDAMKSMTSTENDDALEGASERFLRLNSAWVEANPEGRTPSIKALNSEEHFQLAHKRRDALQVVISLSATGGRGLLAKYKVWRELTELEEEDSPKLLLLAAALVDEYHNFALKAHIYRTAQDDRKPWRLNLHNIFGIFNN
jgi:hypothetical protein